MGSPVGGPGAKGDSLADAARVLGISRQRATALAKRHGIEFQRLQATGKWTKQLRAMAAAKVALSDAARELGISRQRASAIAKRAGILFLRRPAAKRDRARKRLPGSCSECGGAMGEGRWVRCEKCRSAAAERERAKVAERRRAELCPRCGREPEEGKVRARNATWADEGERSGGARPVCRTYENRLLGPRIRLCYKTGRAGQMVPGRLPPGRRCGASRAAAAGRTEPPRRFDRSACGAEPLLSRLGAKRRAKRSARRAWPRSRRGCARDARGPTRVWPSPGCVVTVPTPPAMLVLGRARGFPVLSRGPEGQLRMGRANRWLLHRVDPEDWRPARIAHSAPQRQFR